MKRPSQAFAGRRVVNHFNVRFPKGVFARDPLAARGWRSRRDGCVRSPLAGPGGTFGDLLGGAVRQFHLTGLGRTLAEMMRHVANEAGRYGEEQ